MKQNKKHTDSLKIQLWTPLDQWDWSQCQGEFCWRIFSFQNGVCCHRLDTDSESGAVRMANTILDSGTADKVCVVKFEGPVTLVYSKTLDKMDKE